jgi:hypothetical protein
MSTIMFLSQLQPQPRPGRPIISVCLSPLTHSLTHSLTHRGVASDQQVLDIEQVAVQVLQVHDVGVHEEAAGLAQSSRGEGVLGVHDPPRGGAGSAWREKEEG